MRSQDQSLRKLQTLVAETYGFADDRHYSIFDLLSQLQRFTMRALKGIRKSDEKKLYENLLIAFTWLMAIANRLHIDVEEQVWRRFPALCSYCGLAPCACRKMHPGKRVRMRVVAARRPTSIEDSQEMFGRIYPPDTRTLASAGIHLAEETGEISEAIHNFLGHHSQKRFDEIEVEIADYTSCLFGVANSAYVDVASGLRKLFKNGCHVCHKTPCICTFSEVAAYTS